MAEVAEDDGTLGPGRRRDHLRLGVDFGAVCRRCGARLLDEPLTIVLLRSCRVAALGVVDAAAVQERRVVLCDACAARVWGPVEEQLQAALAPGQRERRAGRAR